MSPISLAIALAARSYQSARASGADLSRPGLVWLALREHEREVRQGKRGRLVYVEAAGYVPAPGEAA